jgi:hypothetical protein
MVTDGELLDKWENVIVIGQEILLLLLLGERNWLRFSAKDIRVIVE